MAETPTLDKMLAVKDQSQAIGEFLDWLDDVKGVELVVLSHEGSGYDPFHYSTERLLAEFFGIDLDAADREKRAILAELGAG